MHGMDQVEQFGWFDKFIWLGVGISSLYWFFESALHVFIFRDGNFLSQLFIREPHELWKRLCIAALILAFSFFAHKKLEETRRSEMAVKESEKKYRTIFQDAVNPILLFNQEGLFVDCNQAALEFLECRRDDMLGKNIKDLTPRHTAGNDLSWYVHGRGYKNLETELAINQRTKTLLFNLVPFTSGQETMVYGIGQDITQRKQMELELIMAHTELNHIFQTASVGMRLIDTDFNVLKVNETFVSLSGADATASSGQKCFEMFAGPMCQKPDCPMSRILSGEKEIECEIDKRRTDGKIVPCLLTARPFLGPNNEITGIVESFKDITELKRTQVELRSERDKLHRILFQRYEGVGIVNSSWAIEYENETLIKQIGDSQGKYCYEVLMERQTPCKRCFMREAIQRAKPKRCEIDKVNGRSYELTYTPFTETDGSEKAVMTLRDITQRKASRAAAIHAEQLAAIGSMAAGVAHEINNPINGIINYGQILLNKCADNELVTSVSDRIVKEGDRIARIVENLLSFTRREKRTKTSVSLGALIEDTLMLTAAQMRKDDINVIVSIPPDLPHIAVVPQEIQQVVVNLLNNAQFALNQKYAKAHHAKTIHISAGVSDNKTRRFLRLSVQDNGTGIPEAIIKKVMNPFFSTKPMGKGTGLGLSISRGIVKDHGGTFFIKSTEGEFTQVDLELPLVAKEHRQGGSNARTNIGR